MVNLELQKKRKEYIKIKPHLPALVGAKCKSCGSEENIVYHHILPLHCGGDNRISNIVPLCTSCHTAIHNGQTKDKYICGKTGGRKPIEVPDEEYAFLKYINGYIGNKKYMQIVAPNSGKQPYQPKRRKMFRNLMQKYKIKTIRNVVDVVAVNGELENGKCVGYVEYENGRKEYMYYTDFGFNDVIYKKRGNI